VRPVKIFATDVEPLYLETAAAGQYADTIAAEVSGERLESHFVQRHGGWQVRPEIRQMVIFARHNLVADPPFTRMDLATCRNALIYLLPAAQERALRRLQYALVPGGHLLLGPSESLGVLHRDFAVLAGRHKIYRLLRRDRLAMHLDGGSRHQPSATRQALHRRAAGEVAPDAPQWVALGQRQLQQRYTPPTLLVGASRELLHVYGNASELLQFGEGQATLDVIKLLPRDLAWAASLLLQAVATEGQAQSAAPVRFGEGAGARRLRMVARRLETGAEAHVAGEHGLTLLSFEAPLDDEMPAGLEPAALDVEQRRRVETLERELDLTHENLQATIEELETANEELQATNEELMASNEELQSTNEELQSVNEELYTVNSEYQEKVDVLNSVNADLENISKATAIPTLFVDEALRLLRFTPELSQLFKVREGDRGRSIEDFANTLLYPDLYADLRRTLADRVVTEREVKSRDGQWWLVRIQPYSARTPGSARAVMTFVNVTSLKDTERMQAVIDSLVGHLVVLDAQGEIVRVNEAWRRFAIEQGDPELRCSAAGSNYLRACTHAGLDEADARAAGASLAEVLAGRRASVTMQTLWHTVPRPCRILMHLATVVHPVVGVAVSHIDITDWATARGGRDDEETTA
jgi:two-component system CheB/CheR fusion protein